MGVEVFEQGGGQFWGWAEYCEWGMGAFREQVEAFPQWPRDDSWTVVN
jgi:hypothetical protein